MTDTVRSRGRPLLLAALPAVLCATASSAQNLPVPTAPAASPARWWGADAQALNAVAITVRSLADTSIVTGTMTGRDGRFRLEGLPLGKYRVHVSYMVAGKRR